MSELTAQVSGLMVMHPGDSPVSTLQSELEIIPEGVRGDSHAGHTRISKGKEVRNNRQVTIVAAEELALVAVEMDIVEIKAEWIGANVLVEGLPDLSALPEGARLRFPGGAVLIVEGANAPCITAGRSIQTHFPEREDLPGLFPRAAIGKRGLLASVEQAGSISVGDAMRVDLPA